MPSADRAANEIRAVVEGLPLLDDHCHGVLLHDPSPEQFERLLDEGGNGAAPGTSRWDTPVGLAVRRHCAEVLEGLPPFPAPEEYLARRRQLGAAEVNRRLLAACRTGGLLLDTGYRSDEIATSAQMAEIVGVPAWEIVRLETVAEDVARAGVTADGYAAQFVAALERRTERAAGLKSVLAYRGGFEIDPHRPQPGDVAAAAGRWFREVEQTGRVRLTDPVLLRFGIWAGADVARRRGLPIQFHVGYGDTDLTLHRTDPSLLSDLFRAFGALAVDVVLLHCYPYHRQAAYLADAFPHVYFDLGLALSFTGASAGRVLADAMEVAPFTKQVYSSDGFGLAELHYLGARHFREGLVRVLGDWVADGACTVREATRIATLVASENARRIYRQAR